MPDVDVDASGTPKGDVTSSFDERFDRLIAELVDDYILIKTKSKSKSKARTKAEIEECLIHTIDFIASEYQLASQGKTLKEVIEDVSRQRKHLIVAVESLNAKIRDLCERAQSRRDRTLSTMIALRDRLGINPELPPTMTDAERVEAGMSFYDANGQLVYGKGQKTCVVNLPAGTTSYRSRYSFIQQSARPVLDLQEIVRHALDVGRRIWSPNYRVTAERMLDVESRVTDEDCNAVNDIFDKPKYPTQRRVWEAFRNRIRRLARIRGDMEEAAFVIDFITDPKDMPKLWRRFARKSEKRWRPQRSMPWHCLFQFSFRKDLTKIDPLLYLQEGRQLLLSMTVGVAPSTSYRAVLSPSDPATANRAIGELIAGASQWFNPFFLLVDNTAIRIESRMTPSVPSPLEAKPKLRDEIISRENVLVAVRRVAPDVGLNPDMRLFKYLKNVKGFSDGDFVPWPSGTTHATRSGTIFVGIKSQLFRINLSDWSVHITSVMDEEEARRTAAAHYRNLRAVYESEE